MLVGYFSDTFAYVFCCSFIYLLIHLPVYLLTCLSTYLFIYLPVYPLTCLIHLLSLLNLLVCLIK